MVAGVWVGEGQLGGVKGTGEGDGRASQSLP